MYDLDIDLEEIEKIRDPIVRNIAHQLKVNGFAVTNNGNISTNISRKFPEFREKKTILMAPDRRSDVNIISINPALINPDKELERFIKKMIKSFK